MAAAGGESELIPAGLFIWEVRDKWNRGVINANDFSVFVKPGYDVSKNVPNNVVILSTQTGARKTFKWKCRCYGEQGWIGHRYAVEGELLEIFVSLDATACTNLVKDAVLADLKKFSSGTTVKLLKGQKVVFTGALQTMTRSAAAEQTEKLGGIYQSGIRSDTTLLVVGDKPGSKLTQAVDRDIKVIDEVEFNKLVAKA